MPLSYSFQTTLDCFGSLYVESEPSVQRWGLKRSPDCVKTGKNTVAGAELSEVSISVAGCPEQRSIIDRKDRDWTETSVRMRCQSKDDNQQYKKNQKGHVGGRSLRFAQEEIMNYCGKDFHSKENSGNWAGHDPV